MAAKKAVATPARSIVPAKVVPATVAPAKLPPAKLAAAIVAPAKIASAKIVPAPIAETKALAPYKTPLQTKATAQTDAPVRTQAPVLTQAPAQTKASVQRLALAERAPTEKAPIEKAAPIELVLAPTAVANTPTKTTTVLPAGTPVVSAQIVKLKTEGKSTMENAMKSTEEFVSFGQGNVEAVMKASQIWATGLQDLSKSFAATAQASLDETMATVKSLASVKSLKEAMEIQSTLAKTAMEKMMAESGKLTDASMKLAEQAIAPLTARVTLAAEKFGRTA